MKKVGFILLLVAQAALAGAQVKTAAPPAAGPWKAWPVGSFAVFKSNAWDTGPVYRRELLLGVDADGVAVVAYQRGDSPDGPWTLTSVMARPADAAKGTPTDLGRKTIDVAGKPTACQGRRVELKTDPGRTTTSDVWTDADTGRKTLAVTTTRGDAGVGGDLTVIEDRLTAVRPCTINDVEVQTAVYLSTTTVNGVLRMSRETAFSDQVPGERVSYQRWAGPPRGVGTAVDEVVVATGSDAEAAMALNGVRPATRPAG